jgi:hypothetical protein
MATTDIAETSENISFPEGLNPKDEAAPCFL